MTAKEFVKGAIKYYAQSIVGLFRALFPKTYVYFSRAGLMKQLYQRERTLKSGAVSRTAAAGVKTCKAGSIPARFNRGSQTPQKK